MIPHYHFCPNCYEREVCQQDCTIEPDLGLTRDGHPKGSPVRCSQCGPEPEGQSAGLAPDKVAELRVLATGWEEKANNAIERAIGFQGANMSICDHSDREASKHLRECAKAVFAIVGKE